MNAMEYPVLSDECLVSTKLLQLFVLSKQVRRDKNGEQQVKRDNEDKKSELKEKSSKLEVLCYGDCCLGQKDPIESFGLGFATEQLRISCMYLICLIYIQIF